MINPNFVHTVTHYHKAGTSWTRSVYHNCCWTEQLAVTQNGTEARQTNLYTVRIPMEEAGDNFSVSFGDLVVKGECSREITGKSPDTSAEILHERKQDGAFLVTAIRNNTAHLLGKHYRLGG